MNIRVLTAAALAAVLMGAHRQPLTVYSDPAGTRPAGAARQRPTDAVLPNGRIAAPSGTSVFVGTNPLGIALSPDGRYAIVADADQNQTLPSRDASPPVVAGYALTVVDTRSMRVVDAYHDDGDDFSLGVAALRDPNDPASTIVLACDGANDAIRVFDLSAAGHLTGEPAPIALPRHGYPESIALSPDHRFAYVAENLGDSVIAIDIASRTVLHTIGVGYAPFGLAATGANLYATNGGLDRYAPLARPTAQPQFAIPSGDVDRQSSLSIVPLSGGDVDTEPAAATVRMDEIPDGVRTVGGARPGAIAVQPDGRYAYVALSNVDRVAIVGLEGQPRVEAGLDLRLFPEAPYGTQPSAVVVAPRAKRVYVALAGLDAIAVLDARNPVQLHRLGLIPTGWYPTALALSSDGRYLFVVDSKGVDGWGMLQRIDLRRLNLMKTTLAALKYQRTVAVAKPNLAVPPLRSRLRSNVIDRIVYIGVGSASYDAMFGDAGIGNGDPALSIYDRSITPNLHALASTYAIADNFYADDMNLDANLQFALGGVATLYTERTLNVNTGRSPFDAHGQDPENYPREGYLFNALARADIGFRDYGGLLALSGYESTDATDGLGGLYTLDVPGLAALSGNVDLHFPLANSRITDAARAREFVADMDGLIRANEQPAFTYVSLPSQADRTSVADADRAVGTIVSYLSNTPHWSSTVVFVVAQGVGGLDDHVNPARSYALVVSPLAKRGYVGHRHLSVASIVKTEEELLGLAPLSLNDFLAGDLADFFGDVPYPSPYQAIP